MSKEYFIKTGGKIYGSFTANQLLDQFLNEVNQHIVLGVYVAESSIGPWQSLDSALESIAVEAWDGEGEAADRRNHTSSKNDNHQSKVLTVEQEDDIDQEDSQQEYWIRCKKSGDTFGPSSMETVLIAAKSGKVFAGDGIANSHNGPWQRADSARGTQYEKLRVYYALNDYGDIDIIDMSDVPRIDEVDVKRSIWGKITIKYECLDCHSPLISDREEIGKRDQCPFCNAEFLVPKEVEQEIRHKENLKREAELNRARKAERREIANYPVNQSVEANNVIIKGLEKIFWGLITSDFGIKVTSFSIFVAMVVGIGYLADVDLSPTQPAHLNRTSFEDSETPLAGSMDGYAWKKASSSDRRALASNISKRLRDSNLVNVSEDFLFRGLNSFFQTSDPSILEMTIGEAAALLSIASEK